MTADNVSPSVREIAALTARLRQLTAAGRTPDPVEDERFLADKRELLDRIAASREDGTTDVDEPELGCGYTRSAADAAGELAAEGRSIEQANAMVAAYLDDVSERVGVPVHRWGLDDTDLDDIRAVEAARTTSAVGQAHEAVASIPEPRTAEVDLMEPHATEPLESSDERVAEQAGEQR